MCGQSELRFSSSLFIYFPTLISGIFGRCELETLK